LLQKTAQLPDILELVADNRPGHHMEDNSSLLQDDITLEL